MELETAGVELGENAPVGVTAGTGMKIEVARDELVAKLGIVSRAVSTRGTVQVLSGILLAADAGTITLAATDMELSLRTTLDAQVDGEGAVVIPGKPLVDLARLLPESEVAIEYRPEEGTVQIVSGATARACTSSTPRTSRGFRPWTRSCTRSTATRCSRRSTGSRGRPRGTSRARS
jgi:hypothetical protein